MYSWNHSGPVASAASSSIVQFEAVETVKGMFALPALAADRALQAQRAHHVRAVQRHAVYRGGDVDRGDVGEPAGAEPHLAQVPGVRLEGDLVVRGAVDDVEGHGGQALLRQAAQV